jgi:hypothetical protein
MRRLALALIAASLLSFARPAFADRPDPSIAVLLSAASTVVPLGGAALLFFTGPGYHEAIRVDLGMVFAALGTLLGPSIGQIYAHGGTDAWVTFFLRGVTGTVLRSSRASRPGCSRSTTSSRPAPMRPRIPVAVSTLRARDRAHPNRSIRSSGPRPRSICRSSHSSRRRPSRCRS